MADESPRASRCVHCGCSCASKTSQGGEGSKRPASLLGASTDDDVPGDERAKMLARRTLDARRSASESGGQTGARVWCGKKWKPSTVPDHVLLQGPGVRHGCQISGDGNIHNIAYATGTASAATMQNSAAIFQHGCAIIALQIYYGACLGCAGGS